MTESYLSTTDSRVDWIVSCPCNTLGALTISAALYDILADHAAVRGYDTYTIAAGPVMVFGSHAWRDIGILSTSCCPRCSHDRSAHRPTRLGAGWISCEECHCGEYQ